MLVTGHMRQIVQACFPESQAEAIELWRNIAPVRFGQRLIWVNGAGSFQTLASYQIPEDASYLAILKTECYVFTETATAPGFRNFEPPPNATARWSKDAGAGAEPFTQTVPIHLLAEASEFLVVKSGLTVQLEALLGAPPDGNTRFIRTTVYAYNINAVIADRIGADQTLIVGADA